VYLREHTRRHVNPPVHVELSNLLLGASKAERLPRTRIVILFLRKKVQSFEFASSSSAAQVFTWTTRSDIADAIVGSAPGIRRTPRWTASAADPAVDLPILLNLTPTHRSGTSPTNTSTTIPALSHARAYNPQRPIGQRRYAIQTSPSAAPIAVGQVTPRTDTTQPHVAPSAFDYGTTNRRGRRGGM